VRELAQAALGVPRLLGLAVGELALLLGLERRDLALARTALALGATLRNAVMVEPPFFGKA